MRILILHNLYQHPGGEDVVFNQETRALESFAKIETLSFQNKKGLKGVLQMILLPWNFLAWIKIKKKISAFSPDIIHFHNLHYAIGPWSIRKIHKIGIPIVMTIHNYRLLCPSATLFYKGKLFTNSVTEKFPWKAIELGIQDGSKLKTAWFAFNQYFHRKIKTWEMVDRYLVLTEFARQLFLNSTFPITKSKLRVKANFTEDDQEEESTHHIERKNHFLFIGRLSEEKGIKTLIKAFTNISHPLLVAGDGPLKEFVQVTIKNHPHIQYLGTLNRDEVQHEMKRCKALIFPSEWFEGMPMTIIESFKNSTPVIATNLGAMANMIEHQRNGLHFELANEEDLIKQLQSDFIWDEEKYARLTVEARKSFEKNYRKEENIKKLENIYSELIKP